MSADIAGFWNDKQAVVTGGGGFLGHHVVEALRAAGCPNIFVPRSKQYDLSREQDVQRMFNDAALKRSSGMPFVVLHLAGLNGGISANKARPASFFYQNITMGVMTLHYAQAMGARKFLAVGAGCGYPESAPMPLREDMLWDGFPQAETAPYALAKRILHVQAVAYWQQHRFTSVVVIPGNIYGPYDNFNPDNAPVIPALVHKFVQAAADRRPSVSPWGTGRATRDFVFAADLAAGILLAAERYEGAEVVNLSSGVDTSIRTVVELLQTITAYEGQVTWDTSRPDGQSARRFDVTKAQHDLGWAASAPLEVGLRTTVDWYRNRQPQTAVMASDGH